MGADFISYCVFGPTELSVSKKVIKKAEKRFTKFVELACQLEDLERKIIDVDSRPVEAAAAAKELKHLKASMLEDVCDVIWAAEYKDNPKKLIDELYDIWHGGSRDSSCRTLPGNKRRKVWFAGEMSWGDEPDGFGYLTMKRADMAGLLSIFGIE